MGPEQGGLERTTGFEPATPTLAKREDIRPSSPPSPVTWSPVRLFVRPARPVRPFRIPVYYRPRANASSPVSENRTVRDPEPTTRRARRLDP
jgi:hypothetical protein